MNIKKILIISAFALIVASLSLFSVYGFPSTGGGSSQITQGEVIAFTTTGNHTWTVPDGVHSVDVLVVGGGGGGGARSSSFASGGGGAGGLIFEYDYLVSPGETISLFVGNGGFSTANGVGGDGENSSFGNITAIGGGGGGYSSIGSGRAGGSGGGEGAGSASGAGYGLGIPGQGYNGGETIVGLTGGGGGGASETGQQGISGNAGNGGDGLYFGTIFGNQYGENGWFSGGGGGNSTTLNGSGGIGGGGDGNRGNGQSGLSSTGGGGGAGGYSSGASGAGGSGIVLIRLSSKLGGSSLNKGLVGHWTLDSEYGAKDTTPYSNHGTGGGGITIGGATDRMGQANMATSFNGVDDYVNMGDDNSLTMGNNSFSFFAWVKPITYTSNNNFLSILGGQTGSAIFYIKKNTGRLGFGKTNVADATDSGTSIELNKWSYVGIVYNGNNSNLDYYVNNTLVKSVVFDYDFTTNTNLIGKRISIYDYWNGLIDDVRIYNRALSEQEISQLYNSYKPKITPNLQKGLVLDMPLTSTDYNSSTGRVSDRSPYDNHGTNYGATFTSEGAEFNGNYIQLPSSLEGKLNGTPSATLSMWIKLNADQNSAANSGIIQLSGYNNGNGNLYYYTDSARDGGIWLDIFRTNREFTGDWQPTFPGTIWHNLTITTTPGTNGWKMYLNGDLKYQTTGEANVSVNSSLYGGFRIGQNSLGRYLKGSVSNVRIYNRALTPEEISLLYSRGR